MYISESQMLFVYFNEGTKVAVTNTSGCKGTVCLKIRIEILSGRTEKRIQPDITNTAEYKLKKGGL